MGNLNRGGGFPAIWYAIRKARQSGGLLRFLRALKSNNACKTCALGMGGQQGGMVDEAGRFPEICKKSMQAMAADMQGKIAPEFFAKYSLDQLATLTPRELEHLGRLATPIYAGPNDIHYRPISWDEAMSRCVTRLRSEPRASARAISQDADQRTDRVSPLPPRERGRGEGGETKPDDNFFYMSGRSSNEAGFLLQLFARLYGTNNVNNCSYYCHQASGVGLSSALGTGTATIALEDLEHCDLIFLIGGNPASNHPRLMRALVKVRRRGGEVIVVNPIRETGLINFAVPSDLRSLLFGSPIASLYLQPHIGGDIALLTGIAKRLDELGHVEHGYIAHCTERCDAWRDHIRATSLDAITWHSGVSHEMIDRATRLYAQSQNAIFAWTMGITHHLHGVDNVRAIVNLALMRGMVGKPGAGLLPIRGHSNVQGIGSVGVTPKLKRAIFDRLEQHYGLKLPTTPGLDTLSCIEAARDGKFKAGWCLGGNLFRASPDAKFVGDALKNLDWLCYFTTTLNTGHVRGRAKETLILPMLARDEEPQPTTQESMFNYVRMSEGGPQRFAGARSEIEVIAELAERVLGATGGLSTSANVASPLVGGAAHSSLPPYQGGTKGGHPIDWSALRQHRNIRAMIAAVVPGWEEIANIDETRREFHVAGRTMHTPTFPTATGRAKFHVVQIPVGCVPRRTESEPRMSRSRDGLPPYQGGTKGGQSDGRPTSSDVEDSNSTKSSNSANRHLRLMTIRSEGQFNTVVYEEEDIYRHQIRRDIILMNPADITRLGLRVDQPITVRSEAGEMPHILVREWDIRAGNVAMYYPEANILVPATADPESRTPAFKFVWVAVEPEAPTGMVQIALPDRSRVTDRGRVIGNQRGQLNAC